MNINVDGGAIFSYSSSSTSSSLVDIVNSNSYLLLNTVNNNNYEQLMGLTDTERRKDATSGNHFVTDHGGANKLNTSTPGKIDIGIKGDQKKIKKPKHAFQTRSQVDILDDGYRWRKYGQKAVKNNKYPRNYYRCTHQGCNVKKQVQRLSNDDGVVVTTYEGVHSHPIDKSTDNFENILTQMQIYSR